MDKLYASTKVVEDPEESDQETFCGEVCKEIGIANSKTNRTRLKNGYCRYKKVMVSHSSHL